MNKIWTSIRGTVLLALLLMVLGVSPARAQLALPGSDFYPGFVYREYYYDIGNGTNVSDFTNSAKYLLHAPDYACATNLFEVNSADTCDNCGERLVGWFVPQESGPHTFYLAADDGAALFLSTDEDPAHKVQIAIEPQWSNRRDWTGDAPGRNPGQVNVSAAQTLNSGSRYYIEAVMKEGDNGDHLAVAVQQPSQLEVPENGSSPITAGFLGIYAPTNGATVNITLQPLSQTVEESRPATFSIAASVSSPACGGNAPFYQWSRNGIAIPGANSPSYTLGQVTLADDGVRFRCAVTVLGRMELSAEALLRVVRDTNPPVLISAAGSMGLDKTTIVFNELVERQTAVDFSNYAVSDGANTLHVTNAVLNPDGRSVTLTTEFLQTQNTVYTVTVRGAPDGVRDLAGNRIAANSTIRFRSFGGCGGLLFEAYHHIGGTSVASLTSRPKFPNQPDFRAFLTTFDSREVYPDDSHDNYGARIRGLFIPPVSGSYIFYLSSDDSSQLFFNPAGPGAAGKVLIQEETNCCAPFSAHASASFPLTANQGYFIEALYKEGNGGDYCQVAAKLATDPTDPNTLYPIPGNWLGYLDAPPGGVGGPLKITQQPLDATVQQNTPATFSVVAFSANGLPICYQWRKGMADIPGATGPTLFLPSVSIADNGFQYSCRVSVPGTNALSRGAALVVVADTTPPTLVSAASVDRATVGVCFSEKVDPASASNPSHYRVNGLPATEATPRPDGQSVLVRPASPSLSGFNLQVNSVTDLAANPIAINAPIAAQFWMAGVTNVNGSIPPGTHFTCRPGDVDVTAGGADIWGTADQFYFVYEKRTNDFDVKVKVQRLDAVNFYSKAGLMARETLDAGSKSIQALTLPPTPAAGVYEVGMRAETDEDTSPWGPNPATELPNAWLRLKRQDNFFTAYHSADGVNWTLLAGPQSLVMGSVVFVGLATTSHDENQFTTAEYRGYGDASVPPAVAANGRLPMGALTERGFDCRLVQSYLPVPPYLGEAEGLLAGYHADPGTGLPTPNEAGVYCFVETGVINYNRDGIGGTNGWMTPDGPFPGIPGLTGSADNFALEVLTYLELTQGLHRFGVNSDDGFRVTQATSAYDANSVSVLGQFDGGRGAEDTLFDFFAATNGLYAMRLVWQQGDGGASLEWWSSNSVTHVRTAINAPGGLRAFRPPSLALPALHSEIAGGYILLSWPVTTTGYCLEAKDTFDLNAIWKPVLQPESQANGRKQLAVPRDESMSRFFRLRRP